MELIDKSVLVSEIEKLHGNPFYRMAIKDVLSIIDTLEVKEVDLEKYYHEFLEKEWFGNSHVRTVSEMMAFTAKHFLELGMAVSIKEQKGEEV